VRQAQLVCFAGYLAINRSIPLYDLPFVVQERQGHVPCTLVYMYALRRVADGQASVNLLKHKPLQYLVTDPAPWRLPDLKRHDCS